MSWLRRTPLPPGPFSPTLDIVEQADRHALLDHAVANGPIFKGRAWGGFWIYVVGLPVCRRLVGTHEQDLRPVTLSVGTLFDKGLLRQMEGEDHHRYRAALVRAIKAQGRGAAETPPLAVAGRFAGLKDRTDLPDAAAAYRAMLSDLVTDVLLGVVLGTTPDEDAHKRLVAAYKDLGGRGLVWNIAARQQRAYADLSLIIRGLTEQIAARADARPSVLAGLVHDGEVDPVMLGNLIYMVEMGRYDMAAFFRWLTWFASRNPDWMERIALADDGATEVAEAFVMEALRMEQSERLVRRVKRDFVFDGFLFPRGTNLRLCIWESHKSDDLFEAPFTFDPGRFLSARPGSDRFAPFGLDRHQCPFGSYSIQLGARFLSELARHYRVAARGDGPAVRGHYHWEPASTFVPELTPHHLCSNGVQ